MTRDDIIHMAREAGFRAGCIELYNGDPLPFIAPCSATDCLPEIERFAAIVAAAHESRFKWYFKQVEPIGTVVVRRPDGKEFVVKNGDFETRAGRDLLSAMIAALSGPHPMHEPCGWHTAKTQEAQEELK